MTEHIDLLVVGGGPAGLATAIEARLAGFEPTVIERRRPPVDVACGEGLMPGGVERLRRLGVEIPPRKGRAFSGIRYLDGDVAVEARFKGGTGLGIRRTVLHNALTRRAEDLEVDLRWGTKVRALLGDTVETDHGPVRARWLVAADGRRSQLRKWSGIEMTKPPPERFGVRRHYSVSPWSDLVEVHWADEGEAYITPVDDDVVGVAILTRRKPLDFDRDIELFPELANRLRGLPKASRDRGAGPFGERPRTVVRDRLALVGDASGSLDPITGEGLSVAFGEAFALVRAIERRSLADYAREHRRILRTPVLLTEMLLEAEKRPWLRRRSIRILAARPWLFSLIVNRVAAAGKT